MPRKQIGQLGFLETDLARPRGAGAERLSRIDGLIDWSGFSPVLDDLYRSRRGEPAYPPLSMFKVLLLQRWYALSDPAMEEALADRLSFRRFVGLSLGDPTPDHTTIHRFRDRLGQGGRLERLMAELARQLDGHGVVVRQGTLIDASLVSSAARRPTMAEGKVSAVDPDARFGANNERRRFQFGYKLHVAVDQFSGLVRDLAISPANRQEVAYAEDLIQGDEAIVYADRGYHSARLRRFLASRGIADGIMRRATKAAPLSPAEHERNKRLINPRRPVEKLFGTLKRCYRLERMPHFAMARNVTTMTIACLAFNLRRLDTLMTP